MKRFLPIIVGVFAGLTASAVMIANAQKQVAHGELTWWDDVVAYGESFNWNNVFSPAGKGENLYALVHNKLLVYPENNALKEIAKNNGLTTNETEAVVGGSITPLFNNPNERITQEDALGMMRKIQEDYAVLKEIFELQQEIDVTVTTSEIFSNNDLGDSGFDLIFDLSVIEEILFVDIIPNTIGGTFENSLESPILPNMTQTQTVITPATSASGPPGPSSSSLEILGSGDGGVSPSDSGAAVLTIGDAIIETEILTDDICTEDEALLEALNAYEAQQPTPTAGSGEQIETELGNIIAEADKEIAELKASGVLTEEGKVVPATADNWLQEWCASLTGADDGAASGSTFGESGFNSLGNVVNSTINQSAGALAATGSDTFSAHIAVCLETSLVKETVSSYQPGSSCVACEIDVINEYMDKTISHSLIPNKVTGNLMESAKCKAAYETPGIDMKFITIAAPVPTPPNDEIIFGKNVFEEWKEFVDRYQPLLFSEVTFDSLLERQTNAVSPNASQQDVVNSVQKDILKYQADALQEIQTTSISHKGTNTILYAQTVGGELKLMTEFFQNYMNQYEEIAGVCKEISQKQYIQ